MRTATRWLIVGVVILAIGLLPLLGAGLPRSLAIVAGVTLVLLARRAVAVGRRRLLERTPYSPRHNPRRLVTERGAHRIRAAAETAGALLRAPCPSHALPSM